MAMKKTEKPKAAGPSDGRDEEIRAMAKKIYQERLAEGRAGDELSDWLEAEKRVKAKGRKTKA